LARTGIEVGEDLGGGKIGNMHDQRVEAGTPLGLKYPRHGQIIARIATKSVDRLGRESDKLTLPQQVGGAGEAKLCRIKGFGRDHAGVTLRRR
jgi:hypothetical protein